jgi:hypothetical protein
MTMFAFDAGQDWGFIERYMGAMLFVAPATFVAVLWALVLTTKGAFYWLSRQPGRSFGSMATDGIVVVASLSLFFVATRLPSWLREVPGGDGDSGLDGLLAPLSQHYLFAVAPWWWANVLLACGLVCLLTGQQKGAGYIGLAACGLTLSYWLFLDCYQPRRDESGYWTWLASMGVLTIPATLQLCCRTIYCGRRSGRSMILRSPPPPSV